MKNKVISIIIASFMLVSNQNFSVHALTDENVDSEGNARTEEILDTETEQEDETEQIEEIENSELNEEEENSEVESSVDEEETENEEPVFDEMVPDFFSNSFSEDENKPVVLDNEGSVTVTIGGLTLTSMDGNPLVEGTDYTEISQTLKSFDTSGSLSKSVAIKMIGINTSRRISISGTSTTHGIRIMPGVKADVILDGVTINTPAPFDVATNMYGTASGAKATKGTDIIDRTTLYLTIADGSVNELTANTAYSFAGLHCGEGSELVIDDGVRNRTNDGKEIVPLQGRIPFDLTLENGTVLKKDDPSWKMDSDNPGSLVVNGGMFSAAIGGENAEESGKMTINGGTITATPYSYNVSISGIASAGTGIGGGCNGGVGFKSQNSGLTINGGNIKAYGSYHGAAIGAGYGNSTATKNTSANGLTLVSTNRGRRDSTYTTSPIPGDITINGGYTEAFGGTHGNAFGGACVSATNAGHTIEINGGTLKPVSYKTTTSYNVGAFGGTVVVTGGSFPIESQSSGGYKGLSFEGTGVYAADRKTELTMVTIAIGSMEGVKEGYRINSFTVMVDGKPLSDADGNFIDYGLANKVDNTQTLYFWLPASAVGKSVTISNVSLMDDDGNIIKADYPFSLPEVGTGDNTTKRWVTFKVDTSKFDEELMGYLYKKYDGLGWDPEILADSIISQNIEVPEPAGETISEKDQLDFTSVRVKDWFGNATSDSSTSGEISTTGTYTITINYNEFVKDGSDFANSFWGHQTTLESIISPAESRIINLSAESTWQDDDHTKFATITLNADVLPAIGEAKTCAAPDGTVQFYINGVKVGKPVALNTVKTRTAALAEEDYDGYAHSNATITLDFTKDQKKYPIPELQDGSFKIEAEYLGGTNFRLAEKKATVTEESAPEEFPFATPPTPTPDGTGENALIPDHYEIDEEGENPILHAYVKDTMWVPVTAESHEMTSDDLKEMFADRYDYINIKSDGTVDAELSEFKVTDEDGNEVDKFDSSVAGKYIIVATVYDKDNNFKTTVTLEYNLLRMNIDTDGDGKPDVNVDTDGDGEPDVNIDTDGDNKPDINIVDKDGDGKPDNIDPDDKDQDKTPDVNIDTDGDGKPDVNVDTDDDGKPDVNVDTDDDGKPDINIVDKDGDGKPDNIDPKDPEQDKTPDVNIVDKDGDGKPDDLDDLTEEEKKELTPDVNVDTDGDGKPDTNVDTDKDGKPDVNIDKDGDGKPDLNIVDKDKDGKPDNINPNDPNQDKTPDVNIVDKDGDGKPDDLDDLTKEELEKTEPTTNIDKDGDGKPDLNVDTNGDGKPDINIDTDGDGKPDKNIDADGDGIADVIITEIPVVNTGDESKTGIALATMMVALVGMILIFIKRKRLNRI